MQSDHAPQAPQRSRWSRAWPLVVGLLLSIVVVSLLYALATRSSPRLQAQPPTTAASRSCLEATPGASPPLNVQVSHDTAEAHSEPMLAQDPANPLHLVGGSKFFSDAAHYRFKIGTYVSFDGGCSWQDEGVLPGYKPQRVTSDVTLAFGTKGEVYAGVLTVDAAGHWGIAVSTSHDGGRSFGLPVPVFHDPTGAVMSDKPWITVDHTTGPRSGTLYVVWSQDFGGSCGDDNGCHQSLGFARSTDHGRSFSPVALVEGTAPFCTNPATGRPVGSTRCDGVLGATPVVLPDGTLAVAFAYIDVMSTGTIPTRMAVTTSRDGGLTWTSPVLVATIADVYGRFPPDTYRNASLPAFACDRSTGQLYLAWADKATGDPDILLATSRDAGATWSAPVRVNDDPIGNGAKQFQPQLAVAPGGVVSVSFFDSRLDPGHRRLDVFLAQSVDHAAIFRANTRVTSMSFDPAVGAPTDAYGNQFIGDYQGLAADDAFVYPFWNDARSGRQEIYTAAVPSVHP